MKFATILREVGICARIFPECANINIILYDEDDHVIQGEDVRFIKPLFSENTDSFHKFFDFVDQLNEEPVYCINVQITPLHVVCNYKTNQAIVFQRQRHIIPMD